MSIIQSFILVPRAFRHMKRYREIIFILVKYGFGEMLGMTKRISFGIFKGFKVKSSGKKNIAKHLTAFERIRMALEELGPTFIKFGQIMSNRPDILPDELIKELEKLQKEVPSFPFEIANKILENELKEKKENYFLEIDPIPLASGSIAQVHKATLRTGEKVVLKIQRPGISNAIETDIEIMQFLARQVQNKLSDFKNIDLLSIINEFKSTIRREIDFNFEVSHIERFQNNFCNDADIYIPKLYKNLCSKTLLVMEHIDGYTINELFSGKNQHIDPKVIAKKGANLILKQIFTFGFFHADPHPGNILILPDSRICFLDYGMTGTLPVKYREFLADIILGFVSRDSTRIAKTLKKFSRTDEAYDLNNLEIQISELVDEFTFIPLNKIDSAQVLNRIKALLVQYKLNLPPELFLLAKTLIIIEGVARKLDPDFNISEYVQPFARRLMSEKVNPVEFFKKNYPKAIDLVHNLLEFPGIAYDISEMIRDGKIKIGFEHKGLSPIIENNKKNSQIIALAIITASVFLTSGIIIAAKIPPFWNNLSVAGLLGFGFSLLLLLIFYFKGRK